MKLKMGFLQSSIYWWYLMILYISTQSIKIPDVLNKGDDLFCPKRKEVEATSFCAFFKSN